MLKIRGTELQQAISELYVMAAGPYGLAAPNDPEADGRNEPDVAADWQTLAQAIGHSPCCAWRQNRERNLPAIPRLRASLGTVLFPWPPAHPSNGPHLLCGATKSILFRAQTDKPFGVRDIQLNCPYIAILVLPALKIV